MLKIEKKIQSELNRLEGFLYHNRMPVEGWLARRGFYKEPGQYEMLDGEWRSLLEGKHIGGKSETVFLKKRLVLDKRYEGQTVVLLLNVGGEGCICVNGKHDNGLDYNRNMVLLSSCAQGGEAFELEIESCCKDLILDSANVFKSGVSITQSETAAINRPAWECFFEMKTGFEFILGCGEEYIRQRVFHVLYDSLLKLDYSEEEALSASFSAARAAYLEGIAEYKELKIPVNMLFAGHSHIDVAWHWPLKETIRKVSRTFSSMLRLMEQYEDFKFCQSMPVLYEMAKEYDPELFGQVKKRVEEGRWETLGSMYLEPDCNLINGESFVRQILYGKKFYKEELGSDSNICFLPDVFGYSPAMPQILKKAGTDYFFTTKLAWNETNEFPYSVFKWRGLDGTEILSGMMSMGTAKGQGLYNGDLSASGVRLSMDRFKNKGNGDPILYLYGHGDGGGGVTKEMLEALTRLQKVPMTPKVEIGTVKQYFEELDKEKDYPVWDGELYFEKHRGTYTTVARNKKNNRKSEFLFRDAEIISVFQYLENGSFQGADLEKGWKKILLNQFHDILPGTCIREVYEESDRDYEAITRIGRQSIRQNLDSMVFLSDDEAIGLGLVTVYNSLSWSRSQVISIKGLGKQGVKDLNGYCPKQFKKADGTILFLAEEVPAFGYRTYERMDEAAECLEPVSAFCEAGEDGVKISNEWLDMVLAGDGTLVSLYDKTARRQILKKGKRGNVLKLLEDIPVEWGSAWETTRKREDKPSLPFCIVSQKVAEHNALYTRISVEAKVHHSRVRQDVIVYHHGPYIEFKTEVDWDETHKMLRVEFPVEVHARNASYDVAFGNAEQPNHSSTSQDEARFEVCGHKWGDVSDGGFGVTLLNDCKYGYSIQNSNMELSLLRSADYPSNTCDKGTHGFSYWIYPHVGGIKEGRVAQAGYEVNVPMIVAEGGKKEKEGSYLHTDCDNIIMDTLKKSEEGEAVILRIFETYHTESEARIYLNFPVKACEETDLLEKPMADVPVEKQGISFKISPYEIKTFKIHLKKDREGSK